MYTLAMSYPIGPPLAPPQQPPRLMPWGVVPGGLSTVKIDNSDPGILEAADAETIAPKPCLTCRRRHVRCDKQLPRCHRCVRFGRVCPGYAPSARSKPRQQSSGSTKRPRLSSSASEAEGSIVGLPIKAESDDLAEIDQDLEIYDSPIEMDHTSLWNILDEQVLRKNSSSSSFSVCSSLGDEGDSQWLSILRNEDVTPCRYFLSMVPFSPLIRNLFLILANSQGPNTSNGSKPPDDVELLGLKSEALEGFIRGIDDGDKSDVMVAATVLLIWIGFNDTELGVFFGSHLIALRELLRARGVPNRSMGDAALPWRPRPLSIFQEYFEEVYVVLGTLGTTLVRRKEDITQLLPLPAVSAICSRSEQRSWVGFPGELLQVLAAVNKLAATPPPASLPVPSMPGVGPPAPPASDELTATLFQRLDEFSPLDWANQSGYYQQCHSANGSYPAPSPVQDGMESVSDDRFHLAAACKGASYIYACRALHIQFCRPLDGVVDEVATHLGQISVDSAQFANTMWPAVVAGMESGPGTARETVRGVLQRLEAASGAHSSHIKQAEALLEGFWANSDQGSAGRSWLDYVYDSEPEMILI